MSHRRDGAVSHRKPRAVSKGDIHTGEVLPRGPPPYAATPGGTEATKREESA